MKVISWASSKTSTSNLGRGVRGGVFLNKINRIPVSVNDVGE